METPAKVMIFTKIYDNLNGQPGIFISAHSEGMYELEVKIRDRRHVVLLPITETVLIYQDPIMEVDTQIDVER